MRAMISVFGSLFFVLQRVIFTPVLLGWLVLWLALGCMIGTLIATPFVFAIFRQTPGESAWHWLVFVPFMFVGAVFGFRDWLMRSGAETFFGLNRDSHGSARFANRKELKKLERADGLLIGRNPHTGRLLRYDGPAHLLTLAPTRAGKGVGTVIPNLLAAERSVLVIDPKGENARIAGEARRRFGTVHVLDPFGVSGMPSSDYNPLDRLHAHLETVFVRMRSLLDYAVKVQMEAERRDIDFSKIVKLKGGSKQYSDKKSLNLNERAGSLFVEDELIWTICSIRDRIVHDGHLDISARLYESFKRRRLVERFILIPDMAEGRFEVFKNRSNFYGRDHKINHDLPRMYDDFFQRIFFTIGTLHDLYASKKLS